jgi:hypothetical protein
MNKAKNVTLKTEKRGKTEIVTVITQPEKRPKTKPINKV